MDEWRPEEWADIAGYEGIYWVSSYGQVLSTYGRHRHRLLQACEAPPYGYLVVNLTHGGRTRTRRVHQLVAHAFLGPRPPGLEICHNDGDTTNAKLVNLRYDTSAANKADTVEHGHNSNRNKTHCPAGHCYDETNTGYRINPSGRLGRYCKLCNALKTKVRKSAQRASNNHFWGHTLVFVEPGVWRCKCGKWLAPGQILAKRAMSLHRNELRHAPGE